MFVTRLTAFLSITVIFTDVLRGVRRFTLR